MATCNLAQFSERLAMTMCRAFAWACNSLTAIARSRFSKGRSLDPRAFGLVLLEAMATGKPVIATAHGGPLDIVEDGRTGDLVDRRTAVAAFEEEVAGGREHGGAGARGLLGDVHGGIPAALAAATAVLVVLYPVCRWYRGVKAARPDSLLRFL